MPLALQTFPTRRRSQRRAARPPARAISAAARWSCAPPMKATCRFRTFVRVDRRGAVGDRGRRRPRHARRLRHHGGDRPPSGPRTARQGGARRRRPGDPQHGDRRRQSVRARALWRFRRRAAGAGRDGRASTASDVPIEDLPGRAATAARGIVTGSQLRVARARRASAFVKVSRVKPKGVSVLQHRRALHRGRRRHGDVARASRLAAWPIGRCAPGRPRRRCSAATLTQEGIARGGRRRRRRHVSRSPTRSPAPGIAAKFCRCISAGCCSDLAGSANDRSRAARREERMAEGSGSVHAQRRGEGRVRRQRHDAAQCAARQARRHLAQRRLPSGHLRRLLGASSTAN